MHAASAVAVAVTFVWLGLVTAISFIEAPLKFRAPGVTLALGLGIGRLVFRALNTVEAVLAAVVVVSFAVRTPEVVSVVAAGVAIAMLLGQVVLVRPRLSRRSDAVLRGEDGPRSHAHWAYVGLECAKVVALIVTGVTLLAA